MQRSDLTVTLLIRWTGVAELWRAVKCEVLMEVSCDTRLQSDEGEYCFYLELVL